MNYPMAALYLWIGFAVILVGALAAEPLRSTWKRRVAMRGFDDGARWLLDSCPACFEKYFHPPRVFWRQAYLDEFWEGSTK